LGSRLSVIRTNKTVLAIAQIAGTFQWLSRDSGNLDNAHCAHLVFK
jgi:hypothetical protein